MSLISAMNNLYQNPVALEAAADEMEFLDLMELETDYAIESLVGDDVDEMLDEDEEMLDEDDEAEEGCCGKGCEAAGPTGLAFLNNLNRDTNDPLVTKPGSLGPTSSAASFPENFSDEYDDDNDPLITKPGSLGPQTSAANFPENYSDEYDDDNDPLITRPGSIGQKTTTPKDPCMEAINQIQSLLGIDYDPVVESAETFGDLLDLDDAAMEGIIGVIKEKRGQMKNSKRQKDIQLLGLQDLDTRKIDSLLDEKKFDQAHSIADSWLNSVNDAMERNKDNKDAIKAGNRLRKSTMSLSAMILIEKITEEEIAKGTDPKTARKIAKNKIKAKRDEKANEGLLDTATEAAINMALNYPACEESIGQGGSAAHYDDNYSGGEFDTTDPVITRDGAEGQDDSAATWDGNHSGGSLDNNDPIDTEDGAVGQEDSTAKDPASEAAMLEALEQLEALSDEIDKEMMGW